MKKILKWPLVAVFMLASGVLCGFYFSQKGDVAPVILASNSMNSADKAEVISSPSVTACPQVAIKQPEAAAGNASEDGIIRFTLGTTFSDKLSPNAKPGKMVPVQSAANQSN